MQGRSGPFVRGSKLQRRPVQEAEQLPEASQRGSSPHSLLPEPEAEPWTR